VNLAFDRRGSGPTLVLLHGLGHRRQGWNAVLDLLTPHNDVITVDLPGHGESPPLRLDGRSPVQAMADETAALFSQLGLERPHVAGNSLGGTLALALAVQHRAASVTAFSPTGFAADANQLGHSKVVFTSARLAALGILPLVPVLSQSVAGRALLYGPMVSRPGRISAEQARGDLPAFVAAWDAIREIVARPEPFVATVPADVPVTLAWGTRDRVFPPSTARIAKHRLPQARFVSLPGCGHVPMTDDPALVARVLLTVSRGHAPASPVNRQVTSTPTPREEALSGSCAARLLVSIPGLETLTDCHCCRGGGTALAIGVLVSRTCMLTSRYQAWASSLRAIARVATLAPRRFAVAAWVTAKTRERLAAVCAAWQ
jgi:pimeloyl-ACP methyl ester carboxylesterase